MSTSGSTNFIMTANEIALLSLQLIGQYGSNKTTLSANNTEYIFVNKLVNLYLKAMAGYGRFLWKRGVGYLFPEADTFTYTISSTGAHCTESFATTITTAAAANAATSLTLSDTSQFSNTMTLLIPKADKTYMTSNITITSSTTVTLGTALTEAVPTSTRVYGYTTKMDKPLKIYKAAIWNYSTVQGSSSDNIPYVREIQQVSIEDYITKLNNATTSGITGYSYLPQLNSGKLDLYGSIATTSEIMSFTYQKIIQDLDSATDDIDLPSEWYLPVAFQVASLMGGAYSLSLQEREWFSQQAGMLLTLALGGDRQLADLILRSTATSIR